MAGRRISKVSCPGGDLRRARGPVNRVAQIDLGRPTHSGRRAMELHLLCGQHLRQGGVALLVDALNDATHDATAERCAKTWSPRPAQQLIARPGFGAATSAGRAESMETQ